MSGRKMLIVMLCTLTVFAAVLILFILRDAGPEGPRQLEMLPPPILETQP